MKFKFLSLLLLFVAIQCVHAQNIYWLRAGGQYLRVTGIQSEDYIPQMGFHAGVGFERIISRSAGWKLEAHYTLKGFSSLEETHQGFTYRSWYNKVEQTSIFFPILGTLNLSGFYLETGPYFDFLVHSRQHEIERAIFYNEEEIVHEFFDRRTFKNPELGFVLGAGVNLFRGIHLSGRYLQGFTPLGNDYNWRRMSQLQLSLTLRIGPHVSHLRYQPMTSATQTQENVFRLISSQQITRTTFNRLDSGNHIIFRWRAAESGSMMVSHIDVESSSGRLTHSGNQVSIREVTFPVSCKVRFTMTHTLTNQSTESYLEFEILQPGQWVVGIWNN